MNILIISECNKLALKTTRRILDQFAERKGRRTWQTAITFEGLKTLRTLLKKSAKRNTAIACYWIHKKNHTELLWMIGNRKKFNHLGTVPTNITRRDILKNQDENAMNAINAIAIMAGIAGLFHDFGKANVLFQNKLNGKPPFFEPYRHEWLSCLLFLAFVKGKSDQQWLTELAELKGDEDKKWIKDLDPKSAIYLTDYPLFAQCIAWLILSHHRLPTLQDQDKELALVSADQWLQNGIDVAWNALNHCSEKFTPADEKKNREFKHGTPIRSANWRSKAKEFSKRALKLHNLFDYSELEKAHPLQLARMSLMLSDHIVSSMIVKHENALEYHVYANTDRITKKLNQPLDEHCINVANRAYLLAKTLPKLKNTLPAITQHKAFKKQSKNKDYKWQNNCFDCAQAIRNKTFDQGFFGVNMASTGKGKTFANAKIMYGLSKSELGCRFSIALGLRTLTLQTADALQERLTLDNDDVAVHIGSQAVKELFFQDKEKSEVLESDSSFGSESLALFSEHQYIRYEGEIDHRLEKWLKARSSAHEFLSAPISVSTIDYLIPVSEGVRGGQQITAMLRLLTSDLVLDEPDDFSLEDAPALGRLVYFAGMLGSRILLSSATLPPALVAHLFACYKAGRAQYNQVNGQEMDHPISCAWFDEFNVAYSEHTKVNDFQDAHIIFAQDRAKKLRHKSLPLHKGDWLVIDETNLSQENTMQRFAETIYQGCCQLLVNHKTALKKAKGKTISTGIVRFANIEPLVDVAKRLFSINPPTNTRIHYCVYHSQHPLAARSEIERQLDSLLKRDLKNPAAIEDNPIVQKALKQYPEKNHVFIVLATPVAEVGRDHDYDWAVIEPSSMRSIIQLVGRVQRHRKLTPIRTNILILNKNLRALKKEKVAYQRPGFETGKSYKLVADKPEISLILFDWDLQQNIDQDTINVINAEPRFLFPQQPWFSKNSSKLIAKNFITLEHLALKCELDKKVKPWWTQKTPHLFGEFQKQTPFRKSQPSDEFVMYVDKEDVNATPELHIWDDAAKKYIDTGLLEYIENPQMIDGISLWGVTNPYAIIASLSEEKELAFTQTCQKFMTINLRRQDKNNLTKKWKYSPALGIFMGEKK